MVLVLNNVCSKHGGKQMGNFRTDLESYIELIKELTGATKVSITLEFDKKVSTPKDTIAEPVNEIIPQKEETDDSEKSERSEMPVYVKSDKKDEESGESGEWLTVTEIQNKYNIGYHAARAIARTLESRVQNKPHTKGKDPLVYNVSQIRTVPKGYFKLNASAIGSVPDGYIPVAELAKIMKLSKVYLLQYIHKNQLIKHVIRIKKSYYCNEAEIRKYRAEQERYADKHGGNIVHKYC